MKIGIIAHLKHPIRRPFMGGLEAFTFEITKSLIQRGHNITLFASEHSDPSLHVQSILSDVDYDRETLSRFRSHELSEDFISTHHAYLELMQDIDEMGFDIIFNNSLNYVPITMATLLQTPMVTVFHTPPIFEMKRAIARANNHHNLHYVSVSNSNAELWKPYVKDCHIISNGIDLEAWEFRSSNERDYVIWFGRIHPDKGTHLAIESAKIAGKRMKVVGSIADRHYFDTYVAPLLDDTVEWIPHCTHEKLNRLIGQAEVSVITPCWEEPFGLVVAESLACGTPIAGFARGALPTLLTDETGCLTASCNTQELASCIEQASRLNRLDCRKHAERTLSKDVMINAYEKLFNRLVHSNYIPHAI